MKTVLNILLLLLSISTLAQQPGKQEKKLRDNLKAMINYLADDKLEGRRTGTPGEKLAYEYIQKQWAAAGIPAFANDKNYLQPFAVSEGKAIGEGTFMEINNRTLKINEEYFPMPYSGQSYNSSITKAKYARHNVTELLNANANNPHYDLYEALQLLAKEDEQKGVGAVFFTDIPSSRNDPGFDAKDKFPALGIPVICIKDSGEKIPGENASIQCHVNISNKEKTGHNIVSFINNNAAATIILGAHYDHLGYGEDHNSLYSGSTAMVHNGADDNASGTAALIEIGRWLKKSTYKKYNYLLINFSGEELGLFGSKYFTEHAGLDLKTVNYMINIDMIGRLNDSTHGLTIGGYGTSPAWGKIINTKDNYFKINTDSSGSGPSDHTSFYRKDIPVLFFFTGSHKDYHKPSDDADKINYDGELQVIHFIQNIIVQTDRMDKLPFTKTRETSVGRSSFKVSLGIMPDYTFDGNGVRVDGVSDNKPAQKAGIKTGDVLLQLGDYKFADVQTYMDALNKFNKGESTSVKLKRGATEMILPVVF